MGVDRYLEKYVNVTTSFFSTTIAPTQRTHTKRPRQRPFFSFFCGFDELFKVTLLKSRARGSRVPAARRRRVQQREWRAASVIDPRRVCRTEDERVM